MNKQATVSLCMIVKNEEAMLPRCLNSVKDLVDEIIIVDTGSEDGTKRIAKEFGAKVFDLTWDNDFSASRNFSMQNAKSDWILLLDADEELRAEDKDNFIAFINTSKLDGCHFTIYSFMNSNNEYTIHKAFRLLRNTGEYEFSGAIHEQIVRKDGSPAAELLGSEDIVLYHYGYLDAVTASKNKRERNIPILLKQLEQEPENSFILFNLGNEYLSQDKTKEALSIYEKAYTHIDRNQAYAPHLYYRMIVCLISEEAYAKAISLAKEALNYYPKCTDIAYSLAMIYEKMNALFLAEGAFLSCIELGEPPSNLIFMNGCGTFRPQLALGMLYLKVEDYSRAIYHLTQAINLDNTQYAALYGLGDAFSKQCSDKDEAAIALSRYFSSLSYTPNSLVYADILLTQGLYEQAKTILEQIKKEPEYLTDLNFLLGKLHFYTRQYGKAFKAFKKSATAPVATTILPDVKKESIQFMAVIGLCDDTYYAESMKFLGRLKEPETSLVYRKLHALIKDEAPAVSHDEAKYDLTVVYGIAARLLRAGERELVERILEALNTLGCENPRLFAGRVYHENGYPELAVKSILQSTYENNSISSDIAFILWKDSLEPKL